MSDQKKDAGNSGRINRGNSQNQISTKTLVGSVLVILAALGIGLAIKGIRSRSVEPQIAVVPEVNETTMEPEIPIIVRPRRVEEVTVEPQPELEPVNEPEPVYEEPAQNEQANAMNNQRMQDAAQWMGWVNNLTPQERMQLFQGVLTSYFSLMQRWQNMPAVRFCNMRQNNHFYTTRRIY